MALDGLPRQRVHADAAHPRGGAREGPVYKRLVQADGLEDLGPRVREERGDAHLGDHLEKALAYGLDVVLRRLLRTDVLQQVRTGEVFYGLEGEVWVDGGGAVADQEGEVVDLPRFGGLHHERGRRPYAGPHQVVVDARRGQQAGYRGLRLAHAPVAKDEHGRAALHRALGLLAQPAQRLLHPLLACRDGEKGGERRGGRALVG